MIPRLLTGFKRRLQSMVTPTALVLFVATTQRVDAALIPLPDDGDANQFATALPSEKQIEPCDQTDSNAASCCQPVSLATTVPTFSATMGGFFGLPQFFGKMFSTTDFPARWNCGTWTAGHGWLHIISDTAVWGAYMAIPLALFYFVRRRQNVPFTGVFWLFMAFIAACGFGHLIEAGIFWWPVYRFSGMWKLLTAVISWATVLSLLPVIPKALAIPDMARINQHLEEEVSRRRIAQEELQKTNEEMQQFYGTAVDREDRVIDLKRQVNEMAKLAGRQAPYDLDFANETLVDGEASVSKSGPSTSTT